MTAEVVYQLGGQNLIFECDERVDPYLMGTAHWCADFLNQQLNGTAIARGSAREACDRVLCYFAVRLIGVTTAGIQLVALGHGREAIMMERAQYEYLVKALYFSHFQEDAVTFLLGQEAASKQFAKRAGFDWEQTAEPASTLSDAFKPMRDKLVNDAAFIAAASQNPLVKAFLDQSTSQLNHQWLWGSQIAHATVLDFQHVIIDKGERHAINVDGRHGYPNRAIASFGSSRVHHGALGSNTFSAHGRAGSGRTR